MTEELKQQRIEEMLKCTDKFIKRYLEVKDTQHKLNYEMEKLDNEYKDLINSIYNIKYNR